MDIGGSLFNSGFLGADFFWWVGQIADDSVWRDNITPGKHANRQNVPGWGRRYKVRIIGLHDKEEESVASDQLPWAQIMYPVTAGGGQGSAFQTANLRQGNFVFGFFLDGKEQSVPVIIGVLGNNSQTKLAQDGIGSAAEGKNNFGPTSGFSDGEVPKKGASKEVVPETDLVVEKPKSNEQAQEEANQGLPTNNLGTPVNKPVSPQQQADIDNARRQGEELGLEGEELFSYIRENVQKGIENRIKNANAADAPVQPGATKETADAIHLTGAADVIRDDLYEKPIPVMKPDDLVGSSLKSMQIVMDNMTQDVDKYMKSLKDKGYIDAVSMNKDLRNLKAVQANAACEISKYMKIIMDKMMEYVSKTLNKELAEKVAQMPSSQRWMMADMKEITGKQTLQNYNQIADNMCGTIEQVLEETLDTTEIIKQFQGRIDRSIDQQIRDQTGLTGGDPGTDATIDMLNDAQNVVTDYAALDPDQDSIMGMTLENAQQTIVDLTKELDYPTKPKLKDCFAEDLAAKVISQNRKLIDTANDNIVKSINYFMNDMQKMLSESGATSTGSKSIAGQIMGFTDEEVLDQVRGGTAYITATSVATGIYGNINPGISTSLGKGCVVNIKVDSGGLCGKDAAQAEHYTWLERGTNYVNGNQSGTICDTSGAGTGMVINMTVAGGEIQTVRVHTMGTGYKAGDIIYPHMQGGPGSIAGNGSFRLELVQGPINPGGIDIIKKGADYKDGDVIFVDQINFGVRSTDATFTTTSTSTKIDKKLTGTGQSLDDILGSITSVGGNLTQALQFKNITGNVFPFELPPNLAVSDMYKLGSGGSSKEDAELPNVSNVHKKVKPLEQKPLQGIPFIEPDIGEPELNFDEVRAKINAPGLS